MADNAEYGVDFTLNTSQPSAELKQLLQNIDEVTARLNGTFDQVQKRVIATKNEVVKATAEFRKLADQAKGDFAKSRLNQQAARTAGSLEGQVAKSLSLASRGGLTNQEYLAAARSVIADMTNNSQQMEAMITDAVVKNYDRLLRNSTEAVQARILKSQADVERLIQNTNPGLLRARSAANERRNRLFLEDENDPVYQETLSRRRDRLRSQRIYRESDQYKVDQDRLANQALYAAKMKNVQMEIAEGQRLVAQEKLDIRELHLARMKQVQMEIAEGKRLREQERRDQNQLNAQKMRQAQMDIAEGQKLRAQEAIAATPAGRIRSARQALNESPEFLQARMDKIQRDATNFLRDSDVTLVAAKQARTQRNNARLIYEQSPEGIAARDEREARRAALADLREQAAQARLERMEATRMRREQAAQTRAEYERSPDFRNRQILSQRAVEDRAHSAQYGSSSLGWEKTRQRLNFNGGADLFGVQARVMTNGLALGGLFSGVRGLLSFINDLDKELKQFQAISQATDNEMAGLRDRFMEISQTVPFTTTEIAKAGTTLAQAGLSAKEVSESIGSIATFATASGSGLSEAVDLVSSALTTYNMQTSQASDVANVFTSALNLSKLSVDKLQVGMSYLGPTAAEMGISLQETVSVLGALSQSGIRASTAATGTRALLVDLQEPSKKFIGVLKELGLTQEDVNVQTNGFLPVLEKLREAGFNGAQAYEAFEVRAAAAYVALSNNTDIAYKMQQAFTLSNSATEAAAIQMESLSATSTRFFNVISNSAYTAFQPVVKALQGILSIGADALGVLGKFPGVLEAVAIGATAVGATVFFSTIGAMVRGIAGAIPVLSRFGIAFGEATAGAGVLRAAWIALLAVLAENPITLIIAAVATLGIGLYALSSHSQDVGKSLDELRTTANDLAGQADDADKKIQGLNDTIDDIIKKKAQLSNDDNPLMKESKILEIQNQFKELGLTIDASTSSLTKLVTEVNNLKFAQERLKGVVVKDQLGAEKDVRNKLIEDFNTNRSNNESGIALKGPLESLTGLNSGKLIEELIKQHPEINTSKTAGEDLSRLLVQRLGITAGSSNNVSSLGPLIQLLTQKGDQFGDLTKVNPEDIRRYEGLQAELGSQRQNLQAQRRNYDPVRDADKIEQIDNTLDIVKQVNDRVTILVGQLSAIASQNVKLQGLDKQSQISDIHTAPSFHSFSDRLNTIYGSSQDRVSGLRKDNSLGPQQRLDAIADIQKSVHDDVTSTRKAYIDAIISEVKTKNPLISDKDINREVDNLTGSESYAEQDVSLKTEYDNQVSILEKALKKTAVKKTQDLEHEFARINNQRSDADTVVDVLSVQRSADSIFDKMRQSVHDQFDPIIAAAKHQGDDDKIEASNEEMTRLLDEIEKKRTEFLRETNDKNKDLVKRQYQRFEVELRRETSKRLASINSSLSNLSSQRSSAFSLDATSEIKKKADELFKQMRDSIISQFEPLIAAAKEAGDSDKASDLQTEMEQKLGEVTDTSEEFAQNIIDKNHQLVKEDLKRQADTIADQIKGVNQQIDDTIAKIKNTAPGAALDALVAKFQELFNTLQGLVTSSNTIQIQQTGLELGNPVNLPADASKRAAIALNRFSSGGLNKNAAIGFVANLLGESNLNPNSLGDYNVAGHPTSGGIAQWHNGKDVHRWTDLTQALGPRVNDLGAQLDYALNELKTKYPKVYAAAQAASSPEEATRIIMKGYESPKDDSSLPRRLSYAKSLVNTDIASQQADLDHTAKQGTDAVKETTTKATVNAMNIALKSANASITKAMGDLKFTATPDGVQNIRKTVQDQYKTIMDDETKKFKAANGDLEESNKGEYDSQLKDVQDKVHSDMAADLARIDEEYMKNREYQIDAPVRAAKTQLDVANNPQYASKYTDLDRQNFQKQVDDAERVANLEKIKMLQEAIAQSEQQAASAPDASSKNDALQREAELKQRLVELTNQKNAADSATASQGPSVTQAIQSANQAWEQQQGLRDQAGNLVPMAQQVGDAWGDVLGGLQGGFETFFTDIFSGTMKAGDAFKKLGLSIVQTIMSIIAKKLATQLVDSIFGGGGAQAGSGGGGGLLSMLFSAGGGAAAPGAAVGEHIRGGTHTRDSVVRRLMPGEFVFRRSAVQAIGVENLENLNNQGNRHSDGDETSTYVRQYIARMATGGKVKSASHILNTNMTRVVGTKTSDKLKGIASRNVGKSQLTDMNADDDKKDQGGVVNVWVVSERPQQMGPNDVIATISDNIQRKGAIKQLIKSVQMGIL